MVDEFNKIIRSGVIRLQVLDKVKELTEERARFAGAKDCTLCGCHERIRKFFDTDVDFKNINMAFMIRPVRSDRTIFEVMVCGKRKAYTIGYWDDYEGKMKFCVPEESVLTHPVRD